MGRNKEHQIVGQWVVCIDSSLFFNRHLELVEGKSYLVVDVIQVPSLFSNRGMLRLIIQSPDGSEVEVNSKRFQLIEDRRK